MSIANELITAGTKSVVAVADSTFKRTLKDLERSNAITLLWSVNEGDAVARATGMGAGTCEPATVLLQNSGLGNALNPLASLSAQVGRLPNLVVGHRGLGADEEQHRLMGAITIPLLLSLGYTVHDNAAAIQNAWRNGGVALALPSENSSAETPKMNVANGDAGITRDDVIKRVFAAAPSDALVVGSTGFISRSVAAMAPSHLRTFSMAGSMGCLTSLAAGLALAPANARSCIVAIEGDAALMMRLEGLIAAARSPRPLLHVVIDNQSNESTGGQASGSNFVDLCKIARAVGYRNARETMDAEDIGPWMRSQAHSPGASMLRVWAGRECAPHPRPKKSMEEQWSNALLRKDGADD